jgi:hypothetical protein
VAVGLPVRSYADVVFIFVFVVAIVVVVVVVDEDVVGDGERLQSRLNMSTRIPTDGKDRSEVSGEQVTVILAARSKGMEGSRVKTCFGNILAYKKSFSCKADQFPRGVCGRRGE